MDTAPDAVDPGAPLAVRMTKKTLYRGLGWDVRGGALERHRQHASPADPGGAALDDLRIGRQGEKLHEARDGCRVEPAQRVGRQFANFTEQRTAKVQRAGALAELRNQPRAGIGGPHQLPGNAKRGARPEGRRQHQDHLAFEGRQASDRPLGGVLTRPRRNSGVRVPFRAQETEHGRQRRQPDRAFPQAGNVQPVLVELETGGQQVGDGLVEACDENASDAGFAH